MSRRIGLWPLCLIVAAVSVYAQNPPSTPPAAPEVKPAAAPAPTPLNPEGTVLLDKANRKLLLKATLCLREGVLEMLVCPKQTKEHESVLSLDARAEVVHAGLLALGAKPGKGVRHEPQYQPPEGEKLEIFVTWTDEKGQPQRRPAQEWVRRATHRYYEAPLLSVPDTVTLDNGDDSLRFDRRNSVLLYYGSMKDERRDEFLKMSVNEDFQAAVRSLYQQGRYQQMQAEFIFTGSGFARTEEGKEIYLAQAGSLICVANFPDAMIDVNTKSTSSNDAGLLYEPWTERLPPLKTPVTVELVLPALAK